MSKKDHNFMKSQKGKKNKIFLQLKKLTKPHLETKPKNTQYFFSQILQPKNKLINPLLKSKKKQRTDTKFLQQHQQQKLKKFKMKNVYTIISLSLLSQPSQVNLFFSFLLHFSPLSLSAYFLCVELNYMMILFYM